jgi:hypothetical protein
VFVVICLRRRETLNKLDQQHVTCHFSIARGASSADHADLIGNFLPNFKKNGLLDEGAAINF